MCGDWKSKETVTPERWENWAEFWSISFPLLQSNWDSYISSELPHKLSSVAYMTTYPIRLVVPSVNQGTSMCRRLSTLAHSICPQETKQHLLDIAWATSTKKFTVPTLDHSICYIMSNICEAEFLVVFVIKSKCYTKINVEQKMRVVASSLIQKFDKWYVQSPIGTRLLGYKHLLSSLDPTT